jgi:hypothetical protein
MSRGRMPNIKGIWRDTKKDQGDAERNEEKRWAPNNVNGGMLRAEETARDTVAPKRSRDKQRQ